MGTPYQHLTDEELLNHIQSSRIYSPIIQSLATRLEKSLTALNVTGDAPDDGKIIKCPICEASLELKFDSEDTTYEIITER